MTEPSPRGGARLAAGLACLTVVGCGVAHPRSSTFVGPVTVVGDDQVCIGGPNASGACFLRDRITRALHVSDCVRVTYTPDASAAYSTATKIEILDRATHVASCPRQ